MKEVLLLNKKTGEEKEAIQFISEDGEKGNAQEVCLFARKFNPRIIIGSVAKQFNPINDEEQTILFLEEGKGGRYYVIHNKEYLIFYDEIFDSLTEQEVKDNFIIKAKDETQDIQDFSQRMIDKYGVLQMDKAVEELSELQKEICKKKIKDALKLPTTNAGLTEEIADVEIMLAQVKLYYNIDQNAVESEKQAKIERTKEEYLS